MQELLVSLWREAQATVFFVTHSIEEAVYLGDRVYIFSSSPGTILREIKVPPPDRPAKEMQREKAFIDLVCEIRDTIDTLESSTTRRRLNAWRAPCPPTVRQPTRRGAPASRTI